MANEAATWGSFQSLFQLSVALNAAFGVLHDVVGNAPKTSAVAAHDLGERAHTVGEQDLAAELFILEAKFTASATEIQNKVFQIIGPICLVVSSISLCFLIASSFFSGKPIACYFQIFSVAQFFPFFGGVYLVLRAAIYNNIQLEREMRAYEAQLKVAERKNISRKG